MSRTKIKSASGVSAVLLSGLLLSACGGSGDSGTGSSGPVSGPTGAAAPVASDGARGSVPAEASSSREAMMAWAKSLGSSDTAEPLKANTFKPPLDDTTETSPG
ncbi:MAG: hypothetical protein ABIP08_11390 [Lautropia sp.]